ncbi:MAG: hypothetical protein OEU40_14475, partial [Gammaproteobacteria bacterium]|nr:hypothetical protein [Gammaproteobacteria bacterium]
MESNQLLCIAQVLLRSARIQFIFPELLERDIWTILHKSRRDESGKRGMNRGPTIAAIELLRDSLGKDLI